LRNSLRTRADLAEIRTLIFSRGDEHMAAFSKPIS